MLTRLTILLFFISTSFINAQIYTPSGTIQGTSWNNDIGIGTNNPTAKLHINNGDNSYGAILANASEFAFSLYTKAFNTVPYLESFRIGLKYLDNENNGFISFYRGGGVSGGFLGFSTNGQERIRISDVGNVGIGINSPTAKLETLNTTPGTTAFKTIGVNGYMLIDNVGSGENYFNANSIHEFQIGGISKMKIISNGNVGIGTTNPASKLSIAGSLTIDGGINNAAVRPLIQSGTSINGEIRALSINGNNYDDGFLRLSAGGGTTALAKSYIDLSGYSTVPDMDRNILFGTHGIERMRINLNGNIGIGTSAPDEKLTVKGKIHTQEVRVDLLGPLVPDYVFANDYKLKSLQEVEAYIKQNSHLPEIPSAKEIEKNGLMLAEMNMSLLKKIEELTLYSIEQNKKIEAQSKEIETLKDLVLRVAKIENDLAKK